MAVRILFSQPARKTPASIPDCVEHYFADEDRKLEKTNDDLYHAGVKGYTASYKLIHHVREE